ncbi:MAG: hypothetical protein KIT87_29300 [Anaerolineae bacterium]|nr:hypothetical protein [Anaerolineae bacterium]
MLTVTLKPDVADQVEAVAQEARLDADTVGDKAVRAYLAQWRREKIRAETVAFEQQRETLLSQYSGPYVALHDGQVVDHDPDLRTLHLRVFARLGHTPVLLKQVTAEPDRDMVFRSPRIEVTGAAD